MANHISAYATYTHAVQALNEQRSPLLRVPIEIRSQIYSHIFDIVAINVAVDNTGCRKYKTYFHPHSKGRLFPYGSKALSLPRTCRKIAMESRFLLLQHATFHIKNSLPFERLLGDLHPAQRNAIRTIHLHRAVATNLGANHLKAVSDATSLLEIWMVPHRERVLDMRSLTGLQRAVLERWSEVQEQSEGFAKLMEAAFIEVRRCLRAGRRKVEVTYDTAGPLPQSLGCIKVACHCCTGRL